MQEPCGASGDPGRVPRTFPRLPMSREWLQRGVPLHRPPSSTSGSLRSPTTHLGEIAPMITSLSGFGLLAFCHSEQSPLRKGCGSPGRLGGRRFRLLEGRPPLRGGYRLARGHAASEPRVGFKRPGLDITWPFCLVRTAQYWGKHHWCPTGLGLNFDSLFVRLCK